MLPTVTLLVIVRIILQTYINITINMKYDNHKIINRFRSQSQINESDTNQYVLTKGELIRLMEQARDKGERDGEILWSEWLDNAFNHINKYKLK